MLLGSYSVLLKSPGRYFGGSTVSDNRSNWGNSGSSRGRYAVGFMNSGSATFGPKNATPNGYAPGYSWVIPIKPGGMASYVMTQGSGSIDSSNLAGGLGGSADLSGTGNITNAEGSLIAGLIASIEGLSSFSSDITAILSLAASLAASGDLAGTASALAEAAAALAGTGDISGDIIGAKFATADLAGVGDVTAAGSLVISISSDLAGTSDLTASIASALYAAADLLGQGNVDATLSILAAAVAALGGSGVTVFDISGLGLATATISGDSSISPAASMAIAAAATIAASGDLSADVTALLNMAIDLAGSGNITDSITALGEAVASITASGAITGSPTASPGSMSADIIITYTGTMTSDQIADAVWNALAARFNDPNTMGELLNGAGGGSSPSAIADAVWDESSSDHVTAGSKGKELRDAKKLILALLANSK